MCSVVRSLLFVEGARSARAPFSLPGRLRSSLLAALLPGPFPTAAESAFDPECRREEDEAQHEQHPRQASDGEEEVAADSGLVVVAAGRQLGILLLPSVGVGTAIAVVGDIAGRAGRQEFVAGEGGGVGVPDFCTADAAHFPVVRAHVVGDVHELAAVAVSIPEGGHDELVAVHGAAHGHGDEVLVVVIVVFGEFALEVNGVNSKLSAVLQVEIVGIHLGAVGVAVTGVVVVCHDVLLADGVEELVGPQVGDEGVDVGRSGAVIETVLPLHDAVEGVGHVGPEGEGSALVPFLVSVAALAVVVVGLNAVLAPSGVGSK